MLAAMLLVAPSVLFGQAAGRVSGVIKDTTGAAIPSAKVVLTDLANGIKYTTTSNSVGAFVFTGLTPGPSYSFKVTAPNFSSWESRPFPVHAGVPLDFTDIALKVGAATAAVTVEAQSSNVLASLDTAAQSDIITAKQLNTLTLVGRDATELVRMLPGFAMSTGTQGLFNRPGYDTAQVGLSGPTGAFSANGAGVTGIETLEDGVMLTDIATNSGTVQEINVNMVQSVTADSSSYGAEYAKGPAVIMAESKTGGSTYHGQVYFDFRTTDLNSNDWYDNYLRQSRPLGRYFYPGLNIGGPLLLPFTDFNRNRDKLFFFVGAEYYNQASEANQEAISTWVPTMAEREGDYSAQSLDAELCGARPDGLPNPNAIEPMCSTDNYLPNGTQITNNNAQPYANSNGVALVHWLPKPNADPFTNPFGYNYIKSIIQYQNGGIGKATLLYNVDPNDKLFLVYGLQREIDQDPVGLNQSYPAGAIPYPGGITTGDISNILSASWTRTIGSSMTNDAEAAMSYVTLPGKMGDPQAVDRFDMNSYNGGHGNFNLLGTYPNSTDLSVPALGSGGSANGYPNLAMPGGFFDNRVFTRKVDPVLQDNYSWQYRNHFLQFGAYWEEGTYNGIADPNAYPQGELTDNPGNGYFEYNPITNVAPYSGCENPSTLGTLRPSGPYYLGSCYNPTAMMYEGYADSWTQMNFTPDVDMRYMTMAGYANDTWTLHNLTLIFGARFEHLGNWVDKHGNGLATLSDSLYQQQCGGYTRNCPSNSANMPGITWHGLDPSILNSVNSVPTIYFTPRVGASWNLFGKSRTILRGGWGIYRNEEQFNPYALASATAQGYRSSYLIGALTYDEINSTTAANPPDFSAYTLSPSDTNRPVYYEYDFSVDERAPWNSMLQFAYVGAHDIHLGSYNNDSYNEASDVNIICGIETGCPANNNPYMKGLTPADSLFSAPLAALPTYMLPLANPATEGIDDMTTEEQDFFRPYPFYQHIYVLKHDFYSNYNSLQVQWNKTSGMLTYGANYTFAKNLATTASYNNTIVDPVNLRNDYIPVPYDRTQVFNINYLLSLGRLYKGSNWLWSSLSNGWQISGISTVESGFPEASVTSQNFGFGYGGILPVTVQYPNQTAPGNGSTCLYEFGLSSPLCVTSMEPVVWLGSPDLELMPTLVGNPKGGPQAHQYINPLAFGLPQPGSQGIYRMPYMHSPYYMDHDVTVLKNFNMGKSESKTLQLRMAAFNVFNHPLVSFNQQDTNNLDLGFNEATVGKPLTYNVLEYQDFGVANIKTGSRLVEMEGLFSF